MAEERSAKTQIAEALNEPKVREEFVDELVVRTRAVETGRKAEEKLAEGGKLTAEEKHLLAAQSVVGKLMQTRKPPKNVTGEMMTAQLIGNKQFTAAADRSGDRLALDLRSGELIRRVGLQAAEKNAAQRTAEKNLSKAAEAKAPENPSVKAPGLGAK